MQRIESAGPELGRGEGVSKKRENGKVKGKAQKRRLKHVGTEDELNCGVEGQVVVFHEKEDGLQNSPGE